MKWIAVPVFVFAVVFGLALACGAEFSWNTVSVILFIMFLFAVYLGLIAIMCDFIFHL